MSNPEIITDLPSRQAGTRVFIGVMACAAASGALAAWHVATQGLTLSHYDARAHLVVARRIVDNLTPGWRQLGAVWLPLPHLLNAIPAQWDWAYRTGAVAVAWSIAILSWGLAALAQRVFLRTGSLALAVLPPALILANPNVLYLQSTPLTEPMLFGLSLTCVAAADAWIVTFTPAGRRYLAWVLAALIMTRYEGWLVAAGVLAIATIAGARQRAREIVRLWSPTVGAAILFLILGYASTGQWWFLSANFFVPEPDTLHRPLKSAQVMITALRTLTSSAVLVLAVAGAVVAVARGARRIGAWLPLSLLMPGLLPLAAFSAGHPFRIRYLVPLVIATAVLAGVALSALPRRLRLPAGVLVLASALWTCPPLDSSAPVAIEARSSTRLRQEREHVSEALRGVYDGTPILASMGSLAHYMHEASSIGLNLRNFLHEGNGDLWMEALRSPRRSVRWILIEDRAEGGDELAVRARTDTEFLSGFDRVAEGGGLVLYRRR